MRRARSVVVADDHSIVRAGMRLLLGGSRFFELVGEARTGTEAIQRCLQLGPDVLLLDLRLPDLPAATVVGRVHERQPDIAIVILTAYEEEAVIRGCIKAGAKGCLFKDVTEHNLLAALMQVAHGRTVIDPRVAGAVVVRDRAADGANGLSDREQEVLRELARGLTTTEIAALLDVSPNTVKTHLRQLFRKLAAHNRVQALSAARDRGLI
jgi:two-component system, NarL family, nitrate/nitrite response regulator NarL